MSVKLNYITEPLEQYVTRTKGEGMKHARTSYHCPLCRAVIPKRTFEEHVLTEHAMRAQECFAMFYGVQWPAKCKCCNRELHYSPAHKGFQRVCGNCMMGNATGSTEYKNADDARNHIAELEAMLANAKEEAKRLEREAELDRIPLKELPFPSKKDPRLLMRVSKVMRVYAVNGEKDKLIELANLLDSKIKEVTQ
jgi:hypothetical protein